MQSEVLPGSFFGPPNLVALIRHRARFQPQIRGFTFLDNGESEESSLTYAELDRRARAIGAWLESLVPQGERALLLYPPGLDFVAGFFGCLYAGVVAVTAYPPRLNRSLDRIERIVGDSGARVAVTTAHVMERVRRVLDKTPSLKRLEWLTTDELPEGIESQWSEREVHPNSLALLQYTSGSTGTPKGVMLSHANLIHNSALISHSFEHTRKLVGVFWLPSYHDMGLVGGILQPLYAGGPIVIMSPMAFLQRPFRWLKAISDYRGTTCGGPNFAYDLCVQKVTHEERATLDLSCWDVAFNGAEPIRADTLDRFARTFASCGFRREAFYPCYGLAEATLIVSGGFRDKPPVIRRFDTAALENGRAIEINGQASETTDEPVNGSRALVSSGQNLPDQRIVIVHPESMLRCKEDEIGEIWVSGPSIAQGYWRRPQDTRAVFGARLADTGEGPFLRTGDLGFLHEGELFVTGRIKDLIIIRGVNHYPQDIELTVERVHATLREGGGAAFTVDVEDVPRLVVVHEMERGHEHELDDIFSAVRREISRAHDLQVDAIVLIRAGRIPKTSSGKIQRHECRRGFLENSLHVLAEWRNECLPEKLDAPEDDDAAERAPLANPPESAGVTTPVASRATTPNRNGPPRLIDAPLQRVGAEGGSAAGAYAPALTAAADHAETAEAVIELVRRSVGGAAAVSLDTSLSDLGLDSLARIELQAGIEDHFGGRMPEEVAVAIETVGDIVRAVEAHLGRSARKERRSIDEITLDCYSFEHYPEYLETRGRRERLEAAGFANPFFSVHEQITADTTVIDGRELINFSSYNYLGMSGHPDVSRAAKEAVDRYGTSVSASRLVSGEKPLHRQLERAIADFLGVEDAIAFVGGHATNESTIGHLFGRGDLILHDALAHNSIVQGAILSGARRRPFPHNDPGALARMLADLRGEFRRVLMAVEGVYSMDGDVAPLPQFIDIKRRYKAFLMVDEAHSAGVLGAHGRGVSEHFGINPADVDIWMGTLSKSFGSCGGYIAGRTALVEYLKYTAPGFVFSVGMTPANAAAALAAIRVIENEPQRVACLQNRSRLFLRLAKAAGLNTGLSHDSAVVPVIVGNLVHCLQLSQALLERGINVQPILYPAVEESASRLRFFITACHSEAQVRTTVRAVREELELINPAYFQRHQRSVASPVSLELAPRR